MTGAEYHAGDEFKLGSGTESAKLVVIELRSDGDYRVAITRYANLTREFLQGLKKVKRETQAENGEGQRRDDDRV